MTVGNIYLIAVLFLLASCNGQTSDNNQVDASIHKVDDYELKPETAHPNAKEIMTEEFYWSSIEESGPFGSDDGSDAFNRFRLWRLSNRKVSPAVFLRELKGSWGYDSDEAVIAVGFGQFVLEGKIDEDVKLLTKMVLTRQLEPSNLERWDAQYQNTRKEQLTKMLTAVDKMN